MTYRGLTPVLVATSVANPSMYFETYGISFSWNANGIYITTAYRIAVEVESGFGIEYKP